jgi:CRP/FNR family cyclic AMP-dependent transcriptional regulator
MRRRFEIHTTLSALPMFNHCTRKQIDQIVSITDQLDLPAGHVLCREGAPGRECFVIVSGEAEVTVDGAHVATIGSGETVGEMALLDGGRRSATVTTTVPTVALVIEGQRFEALVHDVPAVSQAVVRELSGRLREQDSKYAGHADPAA